eukprot:gene31371-30556_t
MYIEEARQREEQGHFEAAELLYIAARQPDGAVDMYNNAKEFGAMLVAVLYAGGAAALCADAQRSLPASSLLRRLFAGPRPVVAHAAGAAAQLAAAALLRWCAGALAWLAADVAAVQPLRVAVRALAARGSGRSSSQPTW